MADDNRGFYFEDEDGTRIYPAGAHVGNLNTGDSPSKLVDPKDGTTYDLSNIGSGGSASDTRVDIEDSNGVVVSDADAAAFLGSADISVSVTDDSDGSASVQYSVSLPSASDDSTEILSSPSDFNFSNLLTVTDDTDGTVTVAVDKVQHLVDSPNYTPPALMMADTDVVDKGVRVPDNDTLEVHRWGAYLIADGTAPAGLQVQLLDGDDTVQASANTANQQSASSPVAKYQNTSGSLSIFKLRVENATGTDYTSDGVGTEWGYRVVS